MKAIKIESDKSLSWSDQPAPDLGSEDIRIKVAASAINRADLVQRKGFYPPPPGASEILGLECAGEVIEVGANVSRYKLGDKVCALLAGGGYAEEVVVHESNALPVPQGLSYQEAAALPEVFATAYLNLFIEAGLKAGEKVILHAGASGVGTAGIQLCKAFANPCFVTLGSEDKLKACLDLGANGGAIRHQGSFVEAAKSMAPFDVILDPVGGAYLRDNFELLGLNGRLVIIGLMGGNKTDIDLATLMMKRIRLVGSTLRARPVAEKALVLAELEAKVWPKIEAGEIKPIVDAVIPMAQAEAAHQRIESDETIGKVILSTEH